MSLYVDGYVVPVPKKNLGKYRRIAAVAEKVWRSHGALDYRECAAEDFTIAEGCGLRFDKLAKLKKGETVVFGYIVFKSRAHRDAVNKKAFCDPRLLALDPKKHPFDYKRMSFAGFRTIVGR